MEYNTVYKVHCVLSLLPRMTLSIKYTLFKECGAPCRCANFRNPVNVSLALSLPSGYSSSYSLSCEINANIVELLTKMCIYWDY